MAMIDAIMNEIGPDRTVGFLTLYTVHQRVATGQFAADMQVHLVNDGPVTIPMQMSA